MEGTPCAAPQDLERAIVEVLRTDYDPEIPVDIHELGLIYGVHVSPGDVRIQMTLTAPACPDAEMLPPEVEAKVRVILAILRYRRGSSSVVFSGRVGFHE